MNAARHMKKLRLKRKEMGKCTRCGGVLIDNKCSKCIEYRKSYNKRRVNGNLEGEKKIKVVRKLKTWEVTNLTLYNAMKDRNMSVKELAKLTDVSVRTVNRWLYENATPKDFRKQEINEIFGEEIYMILQDHKDQ